MATAFVSPILTGWQPDPSQEVQGGDQITNRHAGHGARALGVAAHTIAPVQTFQQSEAPPSGGGGGSGYGGQPPIGDPAPPTKPPASAGSGNRCGAGGTCPAGETCHYGVCRSATAGGGVGGGRGRGGGGGGGGLGSLAVPDLLRELPKPTQPATASASGGPNWIVIIGAVIIIAVVIWWWRKHHKKGAVAGNAGHAPPAPSE